MILFKKSSFSTAYRCFIIPAIYSSVNSNSELSSSNDIIQDMIFFYADDFKVIWKFKLPVAHMRMRTE
jgi:hypothetical protein